MKALRVVVAPDSFKSTHSAHAIADAIRRGWLTARPNDDVVTMPLADGGEGTLDIIHRATPDSWVVPVGEVTGPGGDPVPGHYLALDNQTALIELAISSGLPLLTHPNPLGAGTRGLGEIMRAAIDRGHTRIVVALGGSASTDAGIGALQALGLRVVTDSGDPVESGGGSLTHVATVDASELVSPPGGVTVLRDTSATFAEAPRLFGPQKGASATDIDILDQGFSRLLSLTGDTTACELPGSGAAGGTGWGLVHFLNADLVDGARTVADLVGVSKELETADIIITGEGKLDSTSLLGKVTGTIVELATTRGIPVGLVVGSSDFTDDFPHPVVTLVDQAGSFDAASADPGRWAYQAAEILANQMTL